MAEPRPMLRPAALPPLRLVPAAPGPALFAFESARLGRLVLSLAALALPALGIAAADTVHRVGAPGAQQAAALSLPSTWAAAPHGLVLTASVAPSYPGARP